MPNKLETEGVIGAGQAELMVKTYRDDMDAGRNPNKTILYGYKSPDAVDWTPFLKSGKWDVKRADRAAYNGIKAARRNG